MNVSWIFFSEIGLYCIFWNKIQLLERLSMRLAKANVLYVKVFQAFAVKAFGENTNPALLKFTDEAPWRADDVDQVSLDQLVQEYNIDMDNCPIKSGMISLVYKGQMNGSPVAIKIQRKNILVKLNNGIDNLRFFAALISWMPFLNKFKYCLLWL
jgi:predicted unusual protein kinase regulating ubiquinone biosynthesis (AarF/ABC1/UbiB family)